MKRFRNSRAIVAVACLVLLGGCSGAIRFDYSESAGTFSMAEFGSLADSLDRPDYMGRPVSGSEEMRHEALVDLRKQGPEETALANLITEQFPADTRAVPFWGGKGAVDGREAWIVAEVWGLKGGNLDNVRLWAFDRDSNEVITSAVSN
ncbi:MAG: hypothetical protein ACYC6C_07800 [Coriobacteriia bacterium]